MLPTLEQEMQPDFPTLGAGLGYRAAIGDEILAAADEIDLVEVIADQFLAERTHDLLAQLADRFSVIPHGLELSVGSVERPDEQYLRAIKRVCELCQAPFYSEHLAITRAGGIRIGQLTPLWFTAEALEVTVRNTCHAQDVLGRPLALENVTYALEIPDADMTQAEFFDALVRRTGCRVLLDITNVTINAEMHGFSAAEFVATMPLDQLAYVHLAGGRRIEGLLLDSHSEPIQEESWELLELLASRRRLPGIVIEHDANFPRFDVLVAQVARARDAMAERTTELVASRVSHKGGLHDGKG